jgi:hypothetical protein
LRYKHKNRRAHLGAGSRARTKTAACGAANRGFESHPARLKSSRTEYLGIRYMTENFQGGIASLLIGRLANDALRDVFRTRGYGLYFTDKGLTGVSYKKITSHGYRPAYIFSLVWVTGLVAVIAYSRLSGIPQDQNIPYGDIWGPIILGKAILSLVFLTYASPRRAANMILRHEITSVLDLENHVKDVFLARSMITQVTVQAGRIDVLMRSAEWYYFGVGWNCAWDPRGLRQVSRLILTLFQNYCSYGPPIDMWVKRGYEWQKITPVETPR